MFKKTLIIKCLAGLSLVLATATPDIAYTQTKGSSSNNKDLKVSLEPLAGFETLYRPYPSPHTLTRTMYGARIIVGSELLSGEAEYTKGNDIENFLTAPEKIETKDDKYKLGLRSSYKLTDWLCSAVRLGGQAIQSTVTETNNGVPTTTTKPIEYHPYLGAQLGAKFGPITISVGATAVIRDTSNISNNDIQHTLSINLGK